MVALTSGRWPRGSRALGPILAAAVLAAACGDSSDTPVVPEEPVAPASLEKADGDGQEALQSSVLPVPPTVHVFDANRHLVDGATVEFVVTEGGGSTDPELVVAVDGKAGTIWTLGAEGPQALTARAGQASVQFTAAALPEEDPSTLAITTSQLTAAALYRAAIHIARPLGLDPATRPVLDARLEDGSRVAICTPPASPHVAMTIRRFGGRAFSAADLVSLGSLPEEVFHAARSALRARRNILVSGGTGSGKTTLLNALIELLPEEERIVAIEDTLELRIDRTNCLRFEAGAVGSDAPVSIRDLVRHALRHRPDHIVVGEVRDAEGKRVYRHERLPTPVVRQYTVFNAEQADGLPAARPTPTAEPLWKVHQQAERVLEDSGVPVRHVAGDRAFYNLNRDEIVLPERGQFPSANHYYQTALHELGHSTGHPERMNRETLIQGIEGGFGSPTYAKEELRAEISAMMDT